MEQKNKTKICTVMFNVIKTLVSLRIEITVEVSLPQKKLTLSPNQKYTRHIICGVFLIFSVVKNLPDAVLDRCDHKLPQAVTAVC